MMQRLITGFFFVVILIGGMVWNQYSFGILFLAIAVLSQLEFYKLLKNSNWGIVPQNITGVVAGVTLFVTNYTIAFGYADIRLLALNIVPLLGIFIGELYRNKANPFGNIAYTVLGVVYLALPFSIVSHIVTHISSKGGTAEFYPWLIFGSFMIVWANDSWAYLGGRWFGKHKLFERISPGKTWQGSIVGGIVALGFSYLMALFFDKYTVVDWFVIGAMVIVISTLGDLTESMLKRSLGVKDSGTMLPGHGGILDRFDGMYLALPAVWFYISFLREFIY